MRSRPQVGKLEFCASEAVKAAGRGRGPPAGVSAMGAGLEYEMLNE